eukprot:sb/3469316/
MLALIQLLLVTTVLSQDWTDVDRTSQFRTDFEEYDLQISSTSPLNSVDLISISFGGTSKIEIILSSPAAYKISPCSNRFYAFPVSVSAEDGRIWQIRFDGAEITFSCNDVQLLQYDVPDNCEDAFTNPMKTVSFNDKDTASNSFRLVSRNRSPEQMSCPKTPTELIPNDTQEYCLVSNKDDDLVCGVCDSRDASLAHPPEYVKDSRIKGKTTWWKAENGKINQKPTESGSTGL